MLPHEDAESFFQSAFSWQRRGGIPFTNSGQSNEESSFLLSHGNRGSRNPTYFLAATEEEEALFVATKV